MRGRPKLYTSYTAEAQLFPTRVQKVLVVVGIIVLVLMPFDLPVINQIPIVRFLGDNIWLRLVNRMLVFAIAALGLNILSGLAGQVSLGHAFFMGSGAYAAVLLGGKGSANLWGWGLPIWIWLPASGLVAALVGIAVAPAAVRVRGLYLGIATLGLVFIGLHLSRVFPEIAGPGALGRKWPRMQFRLWKEEDPLVDFSRDGDWFWFEVSKNQKTYLLLLALTVVAAVVAANIAHQNRPCLLGDKGTGCGRRDHGCTRVPVQDDGLRHLLVLRGCRRCAPGGPGGAGATRVMGPAPLHPVHRNPAHWRDRAYFRGSAGHVLRGSVSALHRRGHRLDEGTGGPRWPAGRHL